MAGPFDYHVFSHSGTSYESTDQSAGVNAVERSALEQFFFGQTNDEAYLSSLAAQPGVIWRRAGDRYALTRVVRGSRDSHGRATLQFQTILVSSADAPFVGTRLAQIVVAQWKKLEKRVSPEWTDSPEPGRINAEVVSQAALAADGAQRLVLPASNVTLADVAEIVKRCQSNSGFALCYKSLNANAPTSINFVWGDSVRTRAVKIRKEVAMPSLPPRPSPVSPVSKRGSAPAVAVLCVLLVIQTAVSLYLASSVAELRRNQEKFQAAVIDRVVARSTSLEVVIKDAADRLGGNIRVQLGETTRDIASGLDEAQALLREGLDALRADFSPLMQVVEDVQVVKKVLDGVEENVQQLTTSQERSERTIDRVEEEIAKLARNAASGEQDARRLALQKVEAWAARIREKLKEARKATAITAARKGIDKATTAVDDMVTEAKVGMTPKNTKRGGK